MNGGVLPGAGVGVVAPPMWDQDQSYFSEPEFDSEYQHQHIHKTKVGIFCDILTLLLEVNVLCCGCVTAVCAASFCV
jgi:coenzyme F420-reducing hydrogenase gamma subunit